MMTSTIRIGTASPASGPSRSATLSRLSSLARCAASKKIDILLLPEAFIGGYPRGTSFGCVMGERTAEGRDEFARYFDEAVDLGDVVGEAGGGGGLRWVRRELGARGREEAEERGDGTREVLEGVAKDTGVFIVTGIIEKAGGSLYCAVVYVCPQEGIIGKRRKVMPTGSERLIWAQGAPSTLAAVSTTIRGTRINMAAAICWENYMPLLRASLYAQNINLYLAPTADGRDAWLSLLRTIGIEGRCFVASSNMCVRAGGETGRRSHEIAPAPGTSRRRMSVMDEDGNEIILPCTESTPTTQQWGQHEAKAPHARTDFVSRGGSCIVSPFGQVLAGPQWEDDQSLVYADVDMRDCIRGRLDLDTAGSYSRGDSFRLTVQGLELDPLPY
ncbi:hypothetical protein CDD81_333 [Ophiocordyceps australis]|uniref:CN hydrolase domain-containing protein n=1 Tax=Ophiocordyceps australis TaxID=1399860 RepID=A0A2C5Y1D5_9HYPO|nr:hypothetical protein CDD81_333 [Ophiocordyceps australis]